MVKRDIWLTACGATVTVAAVAAIVLKPTYALVAGALALLCLVGWFCRHSTARVATVGLVSAIGIPVIPGLQELRQPQLIAVSVVFAVLFGCVLAQARARRVGIALALWALLPLVLAGVTVGLGGYDSFRLLVALSTSLVLATAIGVGKTATAQDLETFAKAATAIAIFASVVAIIEYVRQQPLYAFTAFQLPSNSRAAFRASSVFGHPLVLSAFMVCVATLNLAKPMGVYSRWFRSRLLTILVPLVGAAASVSRSAFVLVAAGILALLLMRNEGQIRARRKGFVVLLAIAAGVSLYLALGDTGTFGQRFAELSASSQSVRLNGFAVVAEITTGKEVWIGGGPKSVAQALQTNQYDITLGTTDNQFFDTYADYGLIGLALVVILALAVIRGIRMRGLVGWQRAAVIGAIPALAAFFVLDPLAWYSLAFLFGIGAGAATVKAAAPAPVRERLSMSETSPR